MSNPSVEKYNSLKRKAEETADYLDETSRSLTELFKKFNSEILSDLYKAFETLYTISLKMYGDFDDRRGDQQVITELQTLLEKATSQYKSADEGAETMLTTASTLSQTVREMKDTKIKELAREFDNFEAIELPAAVKSARDINDAKSKQVDVIKRNIAVVQEAAAKSREKKRKAENDQKTAKIFDPIDLSGVINKFQDQINARVDEERILNQQLETQIEILKTSSAELATLETALQERVFTQSRLPALGHQVDACSDICEKIYVDALASKQGAAACYKTTSECSVRAGNSSIFSLTKSDMMEYIFSILEFATFNQPIRDLANVTIGIMEDTDGPKGLLKSEFADQIKQLHVKLNAQ